MMPITGALSSLGGDMQAGARLAVEQINAANAGIHITLVEKDDGTGASDKAPASYDQIVNQGATAIVGPCCSGVTGSILDKAVQDQVVIASPSATAVSLTLDRDNKGFFWRESPSDLGQGKVLAKLVADDGIKNVAVIYVNNAYGSGLLKVFKGAFTTGSLAGVVTKEEAVAETGVTDVSSQVTSVCSVAGVPQTALVIFDYIADGGLILKEMGKQGCLGKFAGVYGSEGLFNSESDKGLPAAAGKDSAGKWLAAGVKGTNPESGDLSAFNAMFKAKYGHDPAQYSAESYDAVMYIALAALKAKSVKGPDIAANMLSVANSPGTKLSDFKAAADAVTKGDDIDWKGQAHDFEFDDHHEPKSGIYSEWKVGDDGVVTIVKNGLTA